MGDTKPALCPGTVPSSSTAQTEHHRQRQLRGNEAAGCNNTKLADRPMIIDGRDEKDVSSAEDVHVRELRRIFDSCDEDRDGTLTAVGLGRLCSELRLDEHKEYITSQLLGDHSEGRMITFDSFKSKFIQLLPQIVDFSGVTEKTKPRNAAGSPSTSRGNRITLTGRAEWRADDAHSRSLPSNHLQQHEHRPSSGQHQPNSSCRPVAPPRRNLAGGMAAVGATNEPVIGSDQDTSNDVLSEFSEDDRRGQRPDGANTVQKRKNRSSLGSESENSSNVSSQQESPCGRIGDGRDDAGTVDKSPLITASDVEQILNSLGLADFGYLGRYEFRILCQHLGLNGLSASDLNGLFNQLDKDCDGRIAVDDFLQVCPTAHPPATGVAGSASREEPSEYKEGRRSRAEYSTTGAPAVDKAKAAASSMTSLTGGTAGGTSFTANDSCVNCGPLAITFGRNLAEKMGNLKSKTVILLGSLDEGRTGHATRSDVLCYWDTLGIENGCDVLKRLGFPERQRWIDLKELSTVLDQELCESVERDSTLLAAVLTLKAEVCYLKESFDESREQASHYLRELQQLNQRNAILVEEMDQSQQNLEMKAQMQLKELEEKHQCRISTLESKYREEREQWHSEMKDKEEFLHKLEQTESGLRSRLRQVERENTKLKTELEDLTQMMKEIEELNRDLRQAVKEAASVRKQQSFNMDSVSYKVSALENGAHGSTRTGRSMEPEVNPTCWKCASTSSTPVKVRPKYTPPPTAALLKRRRMQLSQNRRANGAVARPLDSSEFESDPEPIIFKPKLKRALKKRQRLALIANRDCNMFVEFDMGNTLFSPTPAARTVSSNSSDENCDPQRAVTSFSRRGPIPRYDATRAPHLATPRFGELSRCYGNGQLWENQFQHLAPCERRLADERKIYTHELKMELAAMEDEHGREMRRIQERFEREKEQLKKECKREIESLLHSAVSEKRAALEAQEADLKRHFESQKRDAEIKWATERNVMERKFAEEKMEMMERLQNDFEDELNRLRRAVSNRSPDSQRSAAASMENRLRFEQVMQENMQLNTQLDSLRSEVRTANDLLSSERERSAEMERRIADLQQEINYWETKYNEMSRENAALCDETARVKRDFQDISAEFVILQQRAEEFEKRWLKESSKSARVHSSDVDVQTDGSSMIAVKDESVQLDSSVDIKENCPDAASALLAYQKCHRALAEGVKELEMLLQSGESGFEEEMAVEDRHEDIDTDTEKEDPFVAKVLRRRLAQAQAKFVEIRKSLQGEAACLDQLRNSTKESQWDEEGHATITASRETQTDVEDEETKWRGPAEMDADALVSLSEDENGQKICSAWTEIEPGMMVEIAERLRDENYLLRARLMEQKRLTGQLTDRLQQQMRDTVKVSDVAQKLFARCKSLETEKNGKQRIL